MEKNMRTMLAASAGTFDDLANGMVLRHGSYSSHAGSVQAPAGAAAAATNGGENFDVGPMARCGLTFQRVFNVTADSNLTELNVVQS